MKNKDGSPWNRREFLQATVATVAAASMWPSLGAQGRLPVAGSSDWTRFAYDLHNTRFNARETTLNTSNVGRLKPKGRHEIGDLIDQAPQVFGTNH